MKPITIFIRNQKTNKNKEVTHECLSLLCSLETLVGVVYSGVTDQFDGEPVDEDFKVRLGVGLPIVMKDRILLQH